MGHPDPDRLTLAALPSEPPDPEVEEHLVACALCRDHVTALRRTVEIATGDVPERPLWLVGERPPDRVWEAIRSELDLGVDEPGPVVPPAAPRGRRLLVAAAATVALLVGLGAGVLLGRAAPAAITVASLQSLVAGSPATGTVEQRTVDGHRQLTVRLDGVAAVEGADFLEVWLMDASTTRLVAVGALARDGDGWVGTFTLPGGVPADVYRMVDVSAERFDGNPGHSAVSLLRGELRLA